MSKGEPRDVTVAILRRPGEQLQATLESLARQDGVRVTIVPVEEGATLPDILATAGKIVTFVRAGDVLLSGSLRAQAELLDDASGAVMAHTFWLPLDRNGRISRSTARAHLDRLRQAFPTERLPAGSTSYVQALPTFRREWLLSQAMTTAPIDEAFERLARTAIQGGDCVIRRAAACAIPSDAAPTLPTPDLRFRWDRAKARWGAPARRFLDQLSRTFRATAIVSAARRMPAPWSAVGKMLQRRTFAVLRHAPRPRPRDERIGYVLWRYPTLSETFIRREIEALREAGQFIEVFALESGLQPPPPDESRPGGGITWFGPEGAPTGRAFVMATLRRRPVLVLRLFLYIARVNAANGGRWWRDRDLLYLAGQLASALRRGGITHVHAPWANQYAVIAFVASRLIGVTYSAQARASEIHRTAQSSGVADRLRFAEFVVTNSRYNEQYLAPRLGDGAARVHVIYNGLDLEAFPPAVPRDRSPGSFRLLGVGRLVEPKGFRHLLRACRLLLDRGLDVTCDIIGGPVDPSDTMTWVELRMLQRELGLEERVRLLGAQTLAVVLDAMRNADAFVLPCVRGKDGSHDITPNSLIEAMAMGLPVVSTRSGAVPEIVDDGVNGLLVDPGDETALADAIQRLMGDEDLRRTFSAAARRKVEDRFDGSRNVGRRIELFRSLGSQQA